MGTINFTQQPTRISMKANTNVLNELKLQLTGWKEFNGYSGIYQATNKNLSRRLRPSNDEKILIFQYLKIQQAISSTKRMSQGSH